MKSILSIIFLFIILVACTNTSSEKIPVNPVKTPNLYIDELRTYTPNVTLLSVQPIPTPKITFAIITTIPAPTDIIKTVKPFPTLTPVVSGFEKITMPPLTINPIYSALPVNTP